MLLTNPETGHIDSVDVSIMTYKGRHMFGVLYVDMGRLQDAEAQFRQAVAQNDRYVPSWQALAELCARQGRHDEEREIAERIRELEGVKRSWGDREVGR